MHLFYCTAIGFTVFIVSYSNFVMCNERGRCKRSKINKMAGTLCPCCTLPLAAVGCSSCFVDFEVRGKFLDPNQMLHLAGVRSAFPPSHETASEQPICPAAGLYVQYYLHVASHSRACTLPGHFSSGKMAWDRRLRRSPFPAP